MPGIGEMTLVGMVVLMALRGEAGGMGVWDLSAWSWVILVASAVIGIALGHVFYYAAMARLGVAVASAVIQLAPFLGGVASVLIFHEVLTGGQWTSGFVLLAGAFLLLRAEQRRPQPEPVVEETADGSAGAIGGPAKFAEEEDAVRIG